MGLILVSSSFIVSVHASGSYVGNDNEEFDACSNSSGYCALNNVALEAEMQVSDSSTMAWCPTDGFPCSDASSATLSFQYNPDDEISFNHQAKDNLSGAGNGYAMWFQTGIITQNSTTGHAACVEFTYQPLYYGTHTWSSSPPTSPSGGELPWFWNMISACAPNGGNNPTYIANLYSSSSGFKATWYIEEATDSHGYINDVCFDATGGGFGGNSTAQVCVNPQGYSMYTKDWSLMRSNVCLCSGDSGHTAYFESGSSGTISYVGTTIYARSYPTYIATSEDSDIEYGCVSNNGTTDVTQAFSLSAEC
jgi:hypothetical protein